MPLSSESFGNYRTFNKMISNPCCEILGGENRPCVIPIPFESTPVSNIIPTQIYPYDNLPISPFTGTPHSIIITDNTNALRDTTHNPLIRTGGNNNSVEIVKIQSNEDIITIVVDGNLLTHDVSIKLNINGTNYIKINHENNFDVVFIKDTKMTVNELKMMLENFTKNYHSEAIGDSGNSIEARLEEVLKC